MYRVELTRAAERSLAALPRADLVRLDARISALSRDPRPPGHTKLEGKADLYRIRSGDYRAVYQIDDDRLVVLVVTIGHRRDVYKR